MPNAPASKPTTNSAMVIGIELPGFAKRTVTEQFKQREHLQQRLSGALRGIAHKDRIVLDTSSGAALILFGSASNALIIAASLCGTRVAEAGSLTLRASLALGPIQAVSGDKGEIRMTGDTLDVAESIIALTASEKLICTRAYADALRREAPDCGGALKPMGHLTDTQVREHELFTVQLSHASIHAVRRKRGGQAVRSVRWLSLPVALTASVAVAGAAYILAMTASDTQGPEPIPQVAAAPAPAIKVIKPIPAQRLDPPEVTVVDMSTPAPSEPEVHILAMNADGSDSPKPPARPKPARKNMVVARALPASPARVPVAEQSIEAHEVLAQGTSERGKILLAIAPWGEVLIDGKSVGISPPLTEMELPAGPHYVEVRNNAAEPVLRRVEVQANETLKIRHRFADSR